MKKAMRTFATILSLVMMMVCIGVTASATTTADTTKATKAEEYAFFVNGVDMECTITLREASAERKLLENEYWGYDMFVDLENRKVDLRKYERRYWLFIDGIDMNVTLSMRQLEAELVQICKEAGDHYFLRIDLRGNTAYIIRIA